MTERIEEYTVGELARLAGVSIRTLHHYHAIGLLPPAAVAANGYRLYRRPQAERLQDILFYREAGMDLAEIAALLAEGGLRLDRLTRHRARLAASRAALDRTIVTLDRTIAALKGDQIMATEDLYAPFPPEKQAEYEAWLIERYGPGMAEAVARAKAAQAVDPVEFSGEAVAELREIEAALVAAMEEGIEGAALAPLLDRHRAWVAGMWGAECAPDAYAGLADLYLGHPDFLARYEALGEGFSAWLPAAMKGYAAGS